jgi:solute carrier family 45 protein 1/2/4
MLLLPWVGDFTSYLFYSLGHDHKTSAAVILRGIAAALLILTLNVAIQPVQMGIRALIVEACPPHQQLQATAYASCMTGIGSIFGYASGFVKLPQILPWFGDTQFKCLCVVASLALGVTVGISLSVIEDKKVVFDDEVTKRGSEFFDVFRQIHRSVKRMPRDMKRILKVQFFAWIGWFPFLFYVAT